MYNVYIYIYTQLPRYHVYIYIYIHGERERERINEYNIGKITIHSKSDNHNNNTLIMITAHTNHTYATNTKYIYDTYNTLRILIIQIIHLCPVPSFGAKPPPPMMAWKGK